MLHTVPDMQQQHTALDLRNPPKVWPDYLLAPLPADSDVWRSDNQYAYYLMPNPEGGVHPIAALAREMQDVAWEQQLERDDERPSMTRAQAAYAHHYAQWRDSRVRLALARKARRSKRTTGKY